MFVFCGMFGWIGCGGGGSSGSSSSDASENTSQTQDFGFEVTVYNSTKAAAGTTFFVYKYVDPDILYEVDMNGNVEWSLQLSDALGSSQTEAELLDDGTILLLVSASGLYKIDKQGNILWSYSQPNVSHDADLLANGNIIHVFGFWDLKTDPQVTEIDSSGNVKWQWFAANLYDVAPYGSIDPMGSDNQGWCHSNAVTRLSNGNTMISIRNFNMIVTVDSNGNEVDKIVDVAYGPHDPQVLSNGNILVASQTETVHKAIEIDTSKSIVWEYEFTSVTEFPLRDVNKLDNGNILMTCANKLVEVTYTDKEIVWQLELTGDLAPSEGPSKGFYKAERISN